MLDINEKPACSTCEELITDYSNCGRNSFYCGDKRSATETEPHRRIAQSRSKEIPVKTAPRWCPRKGEIMT